jgi:hypothetical protein
MAGAEGAKGFCRYCKQQRLLQRPKINHILHLLLTLLIWPWVIVWIYLAAKRLDDPTREWRCSVCGEPTHTLY